MHPTVAANHYHCHDYTWQRTGKGQYQNEDGYTIAKNTNDRGWRLYMPQGEPVNDLAYPR